MRRAGLLGGSSNGKTCNWLWPCLSSSGPSCRWIDIPLPSPPKLQGALLVVAMTLGYSRPPTGLSPKRFHPKDPATTRPSLAGGPTGLPTTRNTPSGAIDRLGRGTLPNSHSETIIQENHNEHTRAFPKTHPETSYPSALQGRFLSMIRNLF